MSTMMKHAVFQLCVLLSSVPTFGVAEASFSSTESDSRLPSVDATSGEPHDTKWWARVNNKFFVTPPAHSRLSKDVSDYYYALGSHSGLTEELKSKRVGGDGRVHIFQLPKGEASLLETIPTTGSRRAALSALTQLRNGVVLSDSFPPYQPSSSYSNPLSAAGQALERQLAALLTPDGVMSHLTALTQLPDPDSVSRSYSNSGASQQAADFLVKKLRSFGLTACKQVFSRDGYDETNIVAMLPGKEGNPESVVLGAHYDSRPYDGAAPGAVDNGSGVAGLLSIAEVFAKAKVKPAKTVYFVAFAAEEPGLWGSESFATNLASGSLPEKCAAPTATASVSMGKLRSKRGLGQPAHKAIIMDEIGWKSPKLGSDTVNLESYDWCKDVLENLAQASRTHNGDGLVVVHSNNPFGSDHVSFLKRHLQGVLTIQANDDSYPDYHKSTDSMKNISPQLLTKIAKMNAGALLRLAGVAE